MKRILVLLAAAAAVLTGCEKEPDLHLSENMIGKWIVADIDGQAVPTNDKAVYTILSSTKAYMSASINPRQGEDALWNDKVELGVAISGNKMTLTYRLDAQTTMSEEFNVTTISANDFSAKHKITVTSNDSVVLSNEGIIHFVKVTADYTQAIIGIWEGRCTSEGSVFDDGQIHRWEYKADGKYVYYKKENNSWAPSNDPVSDYFVDGNLLCTRWVSNGVENREWWEVSISGSTMNWTALRLDASGKRFSATFEMKKQ